MKVVILYRPRAEYATAVENFAHDYQVRNGPGHIELTNIDERDGIAMASLYDIMEFPAILAVAVDGTLLQMWTGSRLPLIDEVAAYIHTM